MKKPLLVLFGILYGTLALAQTANEYTVYVLSAPMLRSEDGGRTWETISVPHRDTHDLWINPDDSKNIILADDDGDLKKEGQQLLDRLKTWDGEMVQRKSQAYDDVENFPNKFTAEYLFVMNHCNSALPQIDQPSKDRKKELDAQWVGLKQRAEALMNTEIPNFDAKLWTNGIGAIRM